MLSTSQSPRGINIYDDLLHDAEALVVALRLGTGEPLDEFRSEFLGASVDAMLDSILAVTKAAPVPGATYELTTTPTPDAGAEERDDRPGNVAGGWEAAGY
jgi:hypothetical protein